ncbi:right-handed parallel beta-helix repeat-containing protein [Aestuariibaculum lutulentum]|uniref:Right-handed parallel beta-helix repeat-containing protein n=1 Tax=Aestuariibaculum lutulentum TaxID=2920935 RepID=A0ABS9RHP3_9FLAO|nr:right-handed parallel beta-helix repeat-containing protein [Aestuariibaculum lutulentum]MCH4551719.1 right-handed parallel beta-helix repeat-containing protein [Aestuariibaculum lutulentum]
MKSIKNIFSFKILMVLTTIGLLTSCSDDEVSKTYTSTPGEAALSLPLNNQECEVGDIIDDKADVTFSWEPASDTEKYNLTITNLITRNTTLNIGLTETSTTVKLLRGYPYVWQVTSRNSGNKVTESEVWKFYLAADGEENNVPIPATLVSPLSGATVKPEDGKVTLTWESPTTDTDGDDLTFTVYADTVDGKQEPLEAWKDITETSIEIDVEQDKVYYWHIEVSDGINTSISTTYTFKTGDADSNALEGTIVSTAQELLDAVAIAAPGQKIYVHGGDYAFSSTIELTNSGSYGNEISLLAHPDDVTRPKFDFSAMTESSSNRGIQLSGSFWYIYGIDVYKAGDNGMYIEGNNNLIEFCTFSENSDTGLQLGNGASNNTILNCDSFYNADSTLENADGFACKLDAGTANKFIGCRAWQNLDDGWDGYLRGNDNITTTYTNCWAFKNGILKDGSVGAGDGNGFKTGGSDDKLLKHNAIYKNCIAAGNVVDGFDHNSNRGDITLYNCSAYSNGRNISFSSTNIANSLTIKNTVSLDGTNGDSLNATTTDITNNSWQNGITTDASDFVSLNMDLLSTARNADGSLPNMDFMKLTTGSDLIDAGVNVGLDFTGTAPDIGAFEK